MNDRTETYWLKATAIPGSQWQSVSKADFIKAERNAGFRPKYGGDGCATGGFSDGSISGAVSFNGKAPTY